jgi:galactose mutarotase-like enzyme
MQHVLDNGRLCVRIESHGAELTSIRDSASDIEFLWQGDPAYWNRHAPILFPIVGKLKNNRLRLGDRSYEMSQHGFARNMEFNLLASDDTHARYELRDNKTSATMLPFRFILAVDYTLAGNMLQVKYTVTNPSGQPIHFSIGAHPAFTCPIAPTEEFSDYCIEFEKSETASRWLLQDGLLGEEQKRYLNNTRVIPFTPQLFEDDALVFKGLTSNTVSLKSTKSSHSVTMDFSGFPYFGIWSKPDGSPFVCLEPWYGVADSVGFDGAFSEKEGVIRLDGDGLFECQYSLTFQ